MLPQPLEAEVGPDIVVSRIGRKSEWRSSRAKLGKERGCIEKSGGRVFIG